VIDVVTAVKSNLREGLARAKRATGQSKPYRFQKAFATHLRHVVRL